MGLLDILKQKAKITISETESTPATIRDHGVKPLQGDYAKTIFLWCFGHKPSAVKKRDEYPSYLFYECGIQNAPKYHTELITNGYFMPTPIREKLSSLKVAELKELLQKHGVSSTGKKEVLIETAANSIPSDVLSSLFTEATYILSDKGIAFLQSHDDYVKLHQHPNYQINYEEFDKEKNACPRKFNDICWAIFNRRLIETSDEPGLQRSIYYEMFMLLKEEGRRENALYMLLQVLHLDIQHEMTRDLKSYKNKWISKKEFLERMDNACFVAPGLVMELGSFEDVYTPDIIDRFYGNNNHHICPKKLFSDLITTILAGTYDEDAFRNKIIKEIKKRI